MTHSDLPEPLRKLGGQPYYGEKVKHTLSEKVCQSLETMLLARLLEQEKQDQVSA